MTSDYKSLVPVDPKGLEGIAEKLLTGVPQSPPASITGLLDATAILGADGKPVTKTQKDWVDWYNQQRRVMAAAPDIYQAGRGSDAALLASLRQDFKDSWEMTSSRIIYSQTDLTAKIVHYVDSAVRTPLILPATGSIIVPEYSSGTELATVLRDPNGLKYLQALFNTTDDARAITATLQKFAGTVPTKIWTPDQASRKSILQRAARFGLGSDGFRVGGSSRVGGDDGRSRGIAADAADSPSPSSARVR